ncbi:MAG: hypothetical protein NC078_02120 [Ruminococcus sp.]|nr:hypothetical protein [Ruminococcus sp.]
MKKRRKYSRAAYALAAGMMIFSVTGALTACGGTKEGDTKNAVVNQEEAMKTLAFKITDVPVDDISNIVFKNGKYYGIKNTSETKGEGDDRIYLYSTDIVEFDETGNVTLTIPIFHPTEANSYGGIQSGIMLDDEGNITVLTYESLYHEDTGEYDESSYIRKFAPDGSEISSIDANSIVTEEEQQDQMWLQNVLIDKEGNIILNLYSIIRVLDSSGNKLFDTERLNTDNSWINGMFMTNTGVPAIALYDYSGEESKIFIKEIDVDAKGFGTEHELKAFNMNGNLYGGSGDYICYYSGDTGISGIRADTLTGEQVINLLNIGVDSTRVDSFSVNEDGSFILTGYSNENNQYRQTMSLIKPVAPSEVKEKKILSLGCFYVDWNVRSEVAKFNKENEEYTISVTSYSENNDTSDWNSALTKFNNEILAGNVPDILQINSNMPYDSYAAKGLFTDMYELIEKDGSVTKDSFIPSVLTALETDGKLYSICPDFNVETYVGKKSVIGDTVSMTLEEANGYVAKLKPDATIMSDTTMTALSFLSNSILFNNFVDYKNASCSFDSPEFIAILNAAKEYPAEIDYDKLYQENPNYWEDEQTACVDDRALLQNMYLYDFESYSRTKHGYFKGEELTFTNFPGAADNGSGAGLLSLGTRFAISNKSTFKEGAWEFIMAVMKGTVTEGTISNWSDAEPKEDISGEVVYYSNGNGFPVLTENFDKLALQSTKPSKYVDYDGNIQIQENTYYINGSEVTVPTMSQEDVDFVKNYIFSVTNVYKYDENVSKIIEEESALFFSGSKSAEDTASVIQSKVNIYLNEQYR